MRKEKMFASRAIPAVRLGFKANWQQLFLLTLINSFVGSMVGLERTVLPLIAEAEFGIAARMVTLSFLISFGLAKALANLSAGRLADRIGRQAILIAGWLAGLPVPLMIIFAPNWGWIVSANILLGVNQGFFWSATVVMKMDLVGPKKRGLAIGLNEFAGYFAVSLSLRSCDRIHRCSARHAARAFLPGHSICFSRLYAFIIFCE
jgi:MFS family permease